MTPDDLRCAACGAPRPVDARGLYCSWDCAQKLYRLDRAERAILKAKQQDRRRLWRDPTNKLLRKCPVCAKIFERTLRAGTSPVSRVFCSDTCNTTGAHVKKNLRKAGHQADNLIMAEEKVLEDQLAVLRRERDELKKEIEGLQGEHRTLYVAAAADKRYRHYHETKEVLLKMGKQLDTIYRYSLLPESSVEKVREKLGELAVASLEGATRAFGGPGILENGEVVENAWTPAHAKTFESILNKILPDANAVLSAEKSLQETDRKTMQFKAVAELNEHEKDQLDGMGRDELSALLSGEMIDGKK